MQCDHTQSRRHGTQPATTCTQVCPEDGWLPLLYRCRAKKYHQRETMDTQLTLLEGAPRLGQPSAPLQFASTSPREEPPSSGAYAVRAPL